MDSIKPPGTLKLTGNLDANWKTFKQQFELYLAAIGVSETPNAGIPPHVLRYGHTNRVRGVQTRHFCIGSGTIGIGA